MDMKSENFDVYAAFDEPAKKKLDLLVDQLLDISEGFFESLCLNGQHNSGWDSDGWKFVAEEDSVTITSTSRSTLNCTRGITTFHLPPAKILPVARQIDLWKNQNWKVTESKMLLEAKNTDLSLNYMEFGGWFPVANRDVVFLQYVTKRKAAHVVLWHSCKGNNVTKKSGNVRGKISTSGFVITPLMNNQSIVTFVLQFNLKGKNCLCQTEPWCRLDSE